MPTKTKMTRRDFATLRIDSDKNLMIINNILLIEGSLDFPRLIATIERRLYHYPRFIQKIIIEKGVPYWYDDENFDASYHFKLHKCEREIGQEELQEQISQLALLPLDPNRPLWHMTVFDKACGGYAIVFRFHHCITDGLGLVHMLNHLTDDCAYHSIDPALESHPHSAKGSEKKELPIFAKIGLGFKIFANMAKLSLLLPDSKTRLKRPLSGKKKLIWSPPIEIDGIKAIAKKLHVSLNDVWITSVSGGLRHYLGENGENIERTVLRGVATYNLRDKADAFKMGNEFALVAIDLPSHIDILLLRLQHVHLGMQALKRSLQPQATMMFMSVLGCLPNVIQRAFLVLFTTKASVVMTNLEGPANQRYLAGSRMKAYLCWVPQANNIGVGFSFISYGGQIQIGLYVDTNLVSNPEHLMELIIEEFNAMCKAASIDNVRAIG